MENEHLLWIQNYLKEIYKKPILENFLGLQVVEVKEGKVIFQTKIIDRHCNFYGFVHGGTLASISDIAMGISCITMEKRVVTIDMSTSYIKNAPEGSILTAVGEVISNGKTGSA
jgi:acyl-CoA thioesterase